MAKDQKDQFYRLLAAGIGTVLVGLTFYSTRRTVQMATLPLSPVLNPMKVRVDDSGNGHFDSSRTSHIHQGTDFLCYPQQPVYAPFSGKIIREALPYPDDTRWKGAVLTSNDGYECKLFYFVCDRIGETVLRGEIIGFCQAISLKYGGPMLNHLHVELRKDNTLLNPENYYNLIS